jgi:hypothetical protein
MYSTVTSGVFFNNWRLSPEKNANRVEKTPLSRNFQKFIQVKLTKRNIIGDCFSD